MYKLVINRNNYAIKLINNFRIEQDSNLIEKLELSENIASIAKLNGINSVVALKIIPINY